MHYNSIFSQLFNFILRHHFEKAVKKFIEVKNFVM